MLTNRLILLGFGDILANIFSKLFEKVLAPIIEWAISTVFNMVMKVVREWFVSLWLTIWIAELRVVGVIEKVLDIVSGIQPVTVNDAGERVQMGLLEALISRKPISDAFLAITLSALVLCFLATIIAVGSSMLDSIYEVKRPVVHVLKAAWKAGLTFLMIPLTCILVLSVAGTMGQNINNVFNENPDSAISDSLFVTVAQQGDKHNGKLQEYSSGQRYTNRDNVMKDFNYKDFDYVLAIVSTLLCMLILIGLVLQFIQRAVMIILLYLVSPYFVAFIPLDDGQRFRRWRDMFIANMLSGFGPVLAMRVYMMVCPMITNGDLSFPTIKDQNTVICMQLILVIAGAYAIFQSKYLILQMVSPQVAELAMKSDRMALAAVGFGMFVASFGKVGSFGGVRKSGGGGNAPGKAEGGGDGGGDSGGKAADGKFSG